MNHCGKFANPGFGCGHVVAGLEKLPISLHVTLPPPPVHAPEVTVTSGVFGVYVYVNAPFDPAPELRQFPVASQANVITPLLQLPAPVQAQEPVAFEHKPLALENINPEVSAKLTAVIGKLVVQVEILVQFAEAGAIGNCPDNFKFMQALLTSPR